MQPSPLPVGAGGAAGGSEPGGIVVGPAGDNTKRCLFQYSMKITQVLGWTHSKYALRPVDPALLTMTTVQKQRPYRIWNAVSRCIDYYLAINCVSNNIRFELYMYDGNSGPSVCRSAIVEARSPRWHTDNMRC